MKSLKEEKDHLTKQKEENQTTYEFYRDYHNDLQTICSNVDNILGVDRIRKQDKENTL